MSGHSKWSKVKHQKEVTDAAKGKLFTKAAQAIAIAVREGGGFKLRLAIEKARAVNMPKENIERAVARASGQGSETLEAVLYEAYGPGGAALLIEAVTDNRQRTVSVVRSILENVGGTLGTTRFLFERTDEGFRPLAPYPVSDADRATLHEIVTKLEDLDDVHRVFTNV